MVKSNQPLQIRLTEPVIFLRGPSTGTDFRGRPQTVRTDAQPAMVRGLLTLRLTKPTRIRSIVVTLEGKARTEWPEGIGPRRTETYEEHIIVSESTTFFSGIDSRSQSSRRAQSLGPGVSLSQYDLDDDEIDDDIDLPGVPGEIDDFDASIGANDDNFVRGRREQRPVRSASAMPGPTTMMVGSTDTSRRSSFGRGDVPQPRGFRAESDLGMSELSLRERGPSPAYTRSVSPPRALNSLPVTRNSSFLRESATSNDLNESTVPTRDHILSPIASANVSANGSRNGSERDSSCGTERRRRSLSVLESSRSPMPETLGESTETSSPSQIHSPILAPVDGGASSAIPPGSVRFEDPQFPEREPPSIAPEEVETTESEEHSSSEEVHRPVVDSVVSETLRPRAASVRTLDSTLTSSSVSLLSSQDHSAGEYHPISSVTQTISTTSTPGAPTPQTSRPPSIMENHNRQASSSSASLHLEPEHALAARLAYNSSRRSSLLSREPITDSSQTSIPRQFSPSGSSNDLTETRQGRVSRNGSSSTIVINHGPASLTEVRRSSGSMESGPSHRAANGPSLSNLVVFHKHHHEGDEGRGRKQSKFSLSAAFRGLSQDVKDRVSNRNSSKSRTRAPTSEAGSDIPSAPSAASIMMALTGSGQGSSRRPSLSQGTAPDFITPGGGRGGAGRSRSRERPASPARGRDSDSRSESRGRGRNKGMKALTGAFGIGEHHHHNHDHDEDAHSWKEFRKGTYNYPISFPIPVDAPPTIHAEFGSVIYKLKAVVKRVGALIPNLVDDVEVQMIACPQEDDLEETDNVIVERQWEEQMRYQIALSGKAFPIGGTIPMSLRIMPLLKCRVHRLTVALEEKTDYYALNKRVARHETPRRFNLLAIKQPEKKERIEPLLPIISDSPTAARDSPLAELARQAALNNPRELDSFSLNPEDDVYATLLEPLGPWHLEKDLTLPDCVTKLRFTTKHEKTNVTVGHWLKVTIRVERGDDVALDAKGRRKQFDIIIETPIKILDCRVNSQWNSLPTYTTVTNDQPSNSVFNCPIHSWRGPGVAPISNIPRPPSTLPIASSTRPISTERRNNVGLPPFVPSSRDPILGLPSSSSSNRGTITDTAHVPMGGDNEDSLLERNIVYDRLMSGQQIETGQEPPSYQEAVLNAVRRSRSASRSASRMGRGRERGSELEGGERGVSTSASRSRSRVGRLRD